MGLGVDGNGTRQALEILHILNCRQQSRRVIQACFFDALFGDHHNVIAQEILVDSAHLILYGRSHLSRSGVIGIDVVDVIDIGTVSTVRGVKRGCRIKAANDFAFIAQFCRSRHDGHQLLGIVRAVDRVHSRRYNGLQQSFVIGVSGAVGHDKAVIDRDAVGGELFNKRIQQRHGIAVFLIVNDAESLQVIFHGKRSHDLTLGRGTGLEAEHILIGGSVLFQLAVGVKCKAHNGDVIILRGLLDGIGDVGDRGTDD